MDRFVYPALYGILLWWISTGVMLYVVNRPRSTYAVSLAAATALFVIGCTGLYASASEPGLGGVYIGFLSALAVWSWHEMSFLTGLVTGPNTRASTHSSGRAPLGDAIATVIYHEFAIALTAALVVVLTWGEENQTGTWTFLILWILRLSAKINVYLGVPNITEEFLPAHLRYLKSYFCRRPMNMFFPLSVTATTVAAVLTIWAAIDPAASDGEAAACTLLATLLGLALIEHWFLVLPFDSARLWSWAEHDAAATQMIEVTPRVQQLPITGGAP